VFQRVPKMQPCSASCSKGANKTQTKQERLIPVRRCSSAQDGVAVTEDNIVIATPTGSQLKLRGVGPEHA
jgi:hypothetical protein